MEGEFCQVLVSATSKDEANRISDILITKKLVAGVLIVKGPSRYWWGVKLLRRNIIIFRLFL